jgi:hypothetical protein
MNGLIRFDKSQVAIRPYPHASSDGVLDPRLFEALKADFPTDEIFLRNQTGSAEDGRMKRINLCRYHPEFADLIRGSEAWRTLYEYCNSPDYVAFVLDLFGGHVERCGAALDVRAWHFDSYAEHPPLSLAEKLMDRSGARRVVDRLRQLWRDDALCVNFDIAFGRAGYGTEVHTDNRNKLSAMLIYFNEPGGEGGEFLIHEAVTAKSLAQCERYPRDAEVRTAKVVTPAPNRGVILLNCNNAYHSAAPIAGNPTPRRFLYVSINKRFVDNMWTKAA